MADEDDITPELGRRVAALRQKRGMSQHELAEASKLTVEAVSRIERATREPRIGTLSRLATGLGVSLPQLVDLGAPLPTSRRYRADVERVADFLDDKPAVKVKFIARFARMFIDES